MKKSWEQFKICLLIAQSIQPNLVENGLDWLCYLAGNFQMAPTIFFHIFRILYLYDFIKNSHTRNACAFLPLNISAVGIVDCLLLFSCLPDQFISLYRI